MPPRAAIVLIFIAGVLGTPVSAQTPPGPPGPYVIDVRGAMSALPNTDFFPPVPQGTGVPSRGFGFDVGGHVYPLTVFGKRMGVGLNIARVRGTSSTVTAARVTSGQTGQTGSTAARVLPDVESTLTTIAPQVSFNFGTVDGWSYLSAGAGLGSIETRATPVAGASQTATAAATRSSGSVMSINFGGGARWFLNRHMAFGFDVRFHRLSPGREQAASPGTPGATFFAATVGVSLR